MAYDRRPTSYKEQVEILIDRRLSVENKDVAEQALKEIGYFRFKGYCLPYYKSKDVFKDDVSFNLIYQNYRYDERLRLLVFQIIEHIEIELRSVIGNSFALKASNTGQYCNCFFENKGYHDKWLENFEKLVTQSSKRKELYTKHYVDNYKNSFPIWVALEISDFGSLSKFYNNLRPEIKNYISKSNYFVGSKLLSNWIYILAVVRNICAHNGRLYDRLIPIKAKWSSKEKHLSNDRLFAAIYICKKICLNVDYYSRFYNNLMKLTDEYSRCVDVSKLGFPENWKDILK